MQSKGKIIEMNCLFSSFLIVNKMPFYYSFYHYVPPVIMKHYGARSVVGWIESETALIVNGRMQTSCAGFLTMVVVLDTAGTGGYRILERMGSG